MQEVPTAILAKIASTPALLAIPIYAGLAPAGTPFPYFIYSGPGGADIKTFYERAISYEPFIVQFDAYAAGKNASKQPIAGDYLDALCSVFDRVVTLPVGTWHFLSMAPIHKRLPVLDSLDPKSSQPVFHAVAQYRCIFQTLFS